MAGTSASSTPGLRILELSKHNRTGAPFNVRISAKNHRATRRDDIVLSDGPSCVFVGPIETANKETLEALYRQARIAYYSGRPLIVDDMFDRVELKLRWYGSKSVVKYPRCSLRRLSTYADAEEDMSMVFVLASVWTMFLAIGSVSCLVPIMYSLSLTYQDAYKHAYYYASQLPGLQFLATLNGFLFMAFGTVVGYPIASVSVGVLKGLWRNDLVALKGACPNCGEEVFAFVRSDRSNKLPHKADCHVCERSLQFRTKVEKSGSKVGRPWVLGRIYLIL